MSLPDIGPDPLDPSRWAQRVRRHEPHGLDVLEAHVLAYATEAEEFAQAPKWRIAWNLAPVVALLASIGGFAAVFGNPRDLAIGRIDAPDAGHIPWAMLSYGVAVVGVVLILIRWFVDGRRRNGVLLLMLALVFGFGVLGVLFALRIAADEGLELGTALLPAYVMMALAAVVFFVIALSPKKAPEPEKPPVPIEELSEKGMRYLMSERNQALDTLAERRLLPDIDIEVLKARPLGRLHIEEGK